ncbi:hypothetical protein Clacol_001681 [Clathrus columnatus]|uniref:TRUD domain-containing protein n=1 Tax=Clathrus columnatus TaxID=1419009 RepID=A0AAV5A404_9AGAM|nr:hypothetical protein Clacol_001681 [Clathrus columnatus]
MFSTTNREEHETDRVEDDRSSKRLKLVDTEDGLGTTFAVPDVEMNGTQKTPDSKKEFGGDDNILPPSRSLFPPVITQNVGEDFHLSEVDVGITEYISSDSSSIHGIIKQRFTDFLVNEVDLQGNVVHLKDITQPEMPKEVKDNEVNNVSDISSGVNETETPDPSNLQTNRKPDKEKTNRAAKPTVPPEQEFQWTNETAGALAPFLDPEALKQLEEMYLQGPEPPRDITSSNLLIEDNKAEGWSENPVMESPEKSKRDKNQRGWKEKTKKTGKSTVPKDDREVFSKNITSKEDRTTLHEAVRRLFGGKLETQTDGQRISIKWSKHKGGSAKRGNREAAIAQGKRSPFPYIHFTLQKTNRDTQDALSHLARQLHANVKDLCVAGTKDKRGVTVQRVSFKRNGKTVQDVWKMVNGVSGHRRKDGILTERGERGIRIGDLAYRKGFLELGMLKGNAFIITLRQKCQSRFIGYCKQHFDLFERKWVYQLLRYALARMQRFGTSSIPTHSIGLALLKSEWHRAVNLILRPRSGEYPEAAHARRAWLEDRDLDTALALMPRRVVAERCILENYQKQGGDDRNALGAISTIPKNLRLMYIHAYQSYVWNCIVSERVRNYGLKPIIGDLVFDATSMEEVEQDDAKNLEVDVEGLANPEVQEEDSPPAKSRRKGYVPPRVKALQAEDLSKYTMFDIIMPLPGTDVAYPEGSLGEKYREFLRKDGLDPDDFHRKQKDYTLGGSYRKILHHPKELSWMVMKYTDPDVALAQSEEDQILGFDSPITSEDGPFLALQIQMQLGTAAYATMALREITKADTSSHHQTILTQASDDQHYKVMSTRNIERVVFFSLVLDLFGKQHLDLMISTTKERSSGLSPLKLANFQTWIQSTSFASFMLARAIGGASEGNVQLAIAILSDVTTPANRARALAHVGIAFAICFCIGPPIGAYFASRPVPPTFAGQKLDLNIYATPAIITLILLTIECVFLAVALPETRGKRVKVEKEEVKSNSSTTKAKAPIPVRIALLHRLRRIHLLFLGLFSVFDWDNKQNGTLIGFIGIVSALLQGGYVRRAIPKVGEGNMARRGVQACALAMGILAVIPTLVADKRPLAIGLLRVASVCLAFTSATVVNSLTAYASVQCDDVGINEDTGKPIEEHPELAKGGALGKFRSSGQLGRAIGPLLACAMYWTIGPSATYALAGVFMVGLTTSMTAL